MEHETTSPLDRLIALLLAFFGVPLAFAARVLGCGDAVKQRFADMLRIAQRKGWALRYEGEDDATVQARIDLLAWYAADPMKARRHLARGYRGFRVTFWQRFGHVPCAVLRVFGDALADALVCAEPALDSS